MKLTTPRRVWKPRDFLAAVFAFALIFTAGTGRSAHAAGASPSPAAEAAEEGILLNFRDAPLSAVLEHLSEAAGMVIVEETTVEGRVSVISRQPLTTEEAVALLNTVLAEMGYAAVRKDRVLKIVPLADAKLMNVPVRSGADPRQIEPSDEVVTQIIPLKFADAQQVREDLAPLIPSYADLSANASSNALILTDTAANVRRIVEIVSALDTHLATVAEVQVFQLTYANATEAARLINEIFQQDRQNATAGGGRTVFGGRFPFGRGDSRGEDAEAGTSRAPRVLASADERTNTLVVSGPSDTLRVVEQVVGELDANPIAEEAVLVYPLKNADATNVATVLNDLLSQEASGAQTSRTAAPGGGRSSDDGASRGGNFLSTLMQRASAQTGQSTAGMSGGVYCVADEDTNTVLVLTAPTNFDRLRSIIENLDRPIPQVLIKVLIAEVTWNDDIDVGTEFSILDVEADGDESSLFSDFDIGDAAGGLIYRLVSGEVSAALRALQEVGKTDVLSRPHILTSDNQTATITVGSEVPFIRNTRVTETGQTINTIEYEDIGIILEVTPHINPDGLVIMQVAPEVSNTTDETVPISETVDAPVFAKRSAQTRIAIQDNQTIVIGGLMEDRKVHRTRKVPVLGDIPLLGALFRRTMNDTRKTELLIFLTPHVAAVADDLQEMSRQELQGTGAMQKAVRPGEFDRHIEGMERGGRERSEQESSEQPQP